MVNYQNGKIYKIISDQTDKCYVGSTSEERLCDRMSQHRNAYKRFQNGKGNNIKSFEILQYPDAIIVQWEAYACKSKDELRAREQYWIDQLNCVNKNKAYITDEQKRLYQQQEHVKAARNQSTKIWYQNNIGDRRRIARERAAQKAMDPAAKEARKLYMREYRAKQKAQKE